MIYKQWKRFLAILLCTAMIFTGTSLTSLAAGGGSFILTVSTDSEVVIEPTIVEYQEGQTIRDALRESGHTFEGIDGTFISAVDGVSGSYSIFCNDKDYNLDRAAELITAVEFTELKEDEISFEGRTELLLLMEEYLNLENGVQNYAPAAAAYENALTGLRTANADVQVLYETLNDAIENYDKVISGNDITVTVNAVQDGTVLKNPVITFTDENGYVRETVGTTITLGVTGEYHFAVSDGSYNRTEGTIVISDSETTLDVELPSGEWFGDIQVTRPDFTDDSNSSRVPYSCEQNKEAHTAEYYIEDSYSYTEELLYIYAEQGEDVPDASTTTLRTVYTGLDGKDKSESLTSWESTYAQLYSALASGMEGRTFSLEAWYDSTNGDQSYRMIQSYKVSLTRVPTCSEILLKDENGISLLKGFEGTKYEYEVTTTSEILAAEAASFGTEGYSVTMQVNGGTVSDMRGTLTEGENEVAILVSNTNGQSNTYTFHVTYQQGCTVTVSSQDSACTVEVFNVNDSKIEPVQGNTYSLIPDESYYYVATKNSHYHASEEFTAKEGLSVSVKTPVIETSLTDLALYDTANPTNRLEIVPENEFMTSVYDYTYVVSDSIVGNAYLQATPVEDYTVTALYEGSYSSSNRWTSYETEITAAVDASERATSLNRVYVNGGYGNVITLRVAKNVDNCTYYQDYTLNLKRYLSLSDLTVYTTAGECLLFDTEENKTFFDRDRLEYHLYVSADTEVLSFSGQFMNEGDPEELWYNGGYYAVIKGETYTSLSNVDISLNPEETTETIEILICHENNEAVSHTYLLNIQKKAAIGVTFRVTPNEALVFVVNELDGTRVYPDEKGVFQLMPVFTYRYTVTANGYVGKTVSNYQPDASEDTVKVTVRLNAAEENSTLTELDALWPTFRDLNNNAVLDAQLPITAENAVLYWARGKDSNLSDDVIDGFDGACGHPILVDGYLYTYDNLHIYKIDTVDGSIVAVSPDQLVSKSSFAIQGMTYAEGMVFVGLSNGSVQAFHADTLESLWVYKDVLGGQPNSVITYQDGYIYTGFWVSETATANYVCISVTDEDPEDHFEEKLASWVYPQKGGFYWAGAYISEEFLLVGTDDGENGSSTGYAQLISLDPATGETIDILELPHTGDIRTSITFDAEGTKDYYFATKGGYFYRVSVNPDGTIEEDSLSWVQLDNGTDAIAMSTSTPTIYNGRAYIGVSGSGHFQAYSGHNISVINLAAMEIAYQVPTKGYPQTSGILTTAYEEDTDKVYVYFFDNYTPGMLRVFSDTKGQTELKETSVETFVTGGHEKQYTTGYTLFTPVGAHAEYAICSPIVDEYGTMYFRNDSNYMMALGSTIEKIEVTKLPDKISYRVGSVFNPKGMEVIATYSNGKTRDITNYVSYSQEPLTEFDSEFAITFDHVMYQNSNGTAGVEYTAPMTMITLELTETPDDTIRISGKTRYETSLKIADAYKEQLGVEKFDTVIIASGSNFADALAGSYLAAKKEAPILMHRTKNDNSAELLAYIQENMYADGTIYILGGEGAVSSAVETALDGYHVKRLGGKTRYETNLLILEEAGVTDEDVLICTGRNFADSLSASATEQAILLVGKSITEEQKAFLEALNGNAMYILGGEGAVSKDIENEISTYGEVSRIGGSTRYETSVLIAEKFMDAPQSAVLAYARNFPDGLCGGPLAVSMNAPLILTASGKYSSAAEAYAAENSMESGVVLGGSGLIDDDAVKNIFKLNEDAEIILK